MASTYMYVYGFHDALRTGDEAHTNPGGKNLGHAVEPKHSSYIGLVSLQCEVGWRAVRWPIVEVKIRIICK